VDTSDLTARARIRDAALDRFGRAGFGTPLRRIAADAKVSTALVVHHFGSKAGLIEACDTYAMTTGRERQPGPVLSYLARAMVERADDTAGMFDEMVQVTEKTLADARPVDDPRLRAAVLVSMELGGFALRAQLNRYLGTDPFSPAGFERIGRLIHDLLANGLFEEDR
jgi:AcrR family transcriptional regulator